MRALKPHENFRSLAKLVLRSGRPLIKSGHFFHPSEKGMCVRGLRLRGGKYPSIPPGHVDRSCDLQKDANPVGKVEDAGEFLAARNQAETCL